MNIDSHTILVSVRFLTSLTHIQIRFDSLRRWRYNEKPDLNEGRLAESHQDGLPGAKRGSLRSTNVAMQNHRFIAIHRWISIISHQRRRFVIAIFDYQRLYKTYCSISLKDLPPTSDVRSNASGYGASRSGATSPTSRFLRYVWGFCAGYPKEIQRCPIWKETSDKNKQSASSPQIHDECFEVPGGFCDILLSPNICI